MDVKNLSGNWKKLKATLKQEVPVAAPANEAQSQQNGIKRKRSTNVIRSGSGPHFSGKAASVGKHTSYSAPRKRIKSSHGRMSGDESVVDGHTDKVERSLGEGVNGGTRVRFDHINGGLNSSVELGKYIALDCEMVGIGPPPHLESALARISIVNYNGDCIYDSYVKPLETVMDWRTHVSGIEEKHMIRARSLAQVQKDVSEIKEGRVVVGHSIRGDWNALLLSHPERLVRDTAKHAAFRKLAGGGSPKLKILASELLGLEIQTGEHSSIEDARATMMLYRRHKDAFEREAAKRWPVKTGDVFKPEESVDTTKKKSKKKKKKKKK